MRVEAGKCVRELAGASMHALMRTLVLHTPKGGSGKSTLAREIAVAAGLAGVQTALAYLDPQGTTTGGDKRRKAATPILVAFTPANSGEELRAAGVELLVVDTPPGQPAYLEGLLRRADAVLVPVRPTPDDLLGAAPIARSLATHPSWALDPHRCRPDPAIGERHPAAGGAGQGSTRPHDIPGGLSGRRDLISQAALEYTGKAAGDTASLYSDSATQLLAGGSVPRPKADSRTLWRFPKRSR